jgi:DNA invertase Pin-like site-specific DNA recombinase
LRIIKRTHEGRRIAQARGVRMGRKPKLTPHQQEEARQRLAKGEPTRDLAKSYGVSVSTISRLIERGRQIVSFPTRSKVG